MPESPHSAPSLVDSFLTSISDETLRQQMADRLRPLADVKSIADLTRIAERYDDPENASLAVFLLSRAAEPTSAGAFLGKLLAQCPDPNIRFDVAAALEHVQDSSAEAALTSALHNDADVDVRARAAQALGHVRGPSASRVLSSVLKQSDEHWRVLDEAAEALAFAGDSEALPVLRAALSHPRAEVRFSAVYALGAIGDESVIQSLEAIAASDSGSTDAGSVADEAREAIAEIHRRTRKDPAGNR